MQVRKNKYPSTPSHEVIQRVTAHEAQQKGNKRDMFRFNSGKQKKVWPDYNPYTIRNCSSCPLAQGKGKMALAFVPSNEVCAGCILVRSMNKSQNKLEFERLKTDPNYKDVAYDEVYGGVKATHVEHNLDNKKGWYELSAQNVGFRNGHSVILEKEDHTHHREKNTEGLWDGESFEIAGAEKGTENNIIRALKHCAKKDADIAVIFFPNENYDTATFEQAYGRFYGLKKLNDRQYRQFKLIYCINNVDIVYIKNQVEYSTWLERGRVS